MILSLKQNSLKFCLIFHYVAFRSFRPCVFKYLLFIFAGISLVILKGR